MGSFNDDERSTNEKLTALDEKLSYASPSDTKLLDEASEQLKEIIEDDFDRLYRKYKWILSVPDVDDGEGLNKNVNDKYISMEETQFNLLFSILNTF